MNRAAIVTGASRGIGHGIATRLAERGYGLTVSARDQARLDEVATFLRARGASEVLAVSTDMADPDAAADLVGLHREKFESLSTLVLNAGMATTGLLGDYEMRGFDEAIEVNLRAPFALLQEALPLLREWAATEPQRGAKVIALSSITGVFAEPGLAVYGSTKAALSSLIDAINLELSGQGVTGTAIEPGFVDTDMTAGIHNKVAPTTMIKVDDIVEIVDAILRLSSRAVVPSILLSRAGTDGRRA